MRVQLELEVDSDLLDEIAKRLRRRADDCRGSSTDRVVAKIARLKRVPKKSRGRRVRWSGESLRDLEIQRDYLQTLASYYDLAAALVLGDVVDLDDDALEAVFDYVRTVGRAAADRPGLLRVEDRLNASFGFLRKSKREQELESAFELRVAEAAEAILDEMRRVCGAENLPCP